MFFLEISVFEFLSARRRLLFFLVSVLLCNISLPIISFLHESFPYSLSLFCSFGVSLFLSASLLCRISLSMYAFFFFRLPHLLHAFLCMKPFAQCFQLSLTAHALIFSLFTAAGFLWRSICVDFPPFSCFLFFGSCKRFASLPLCK